MGVVKNNWHSFRISQSTGHPAVIIFAVPVRRFKNGLGRNVDVYDDIFCYHSSLTERNRTQMFNTPAVY